MIKNFLSTCFFSFSLLHAQDVINLTNSQNQTFDPYHAPSPIVYVSDSGSALAFVNVNFATFNNIFSYFMPKGSLAFEQFSGPYTVQSNKNASYTNTTMNASGEGILVLNTQNTSTSLTAYRFHLGSNNVEFEAIPAITVSGSGVYDPAVGIDGLGNVVCAWKNASATSSGAQVYVSCLKRGSTAWSVPFLVASPTINRACSAVRVALNARGDGIILWNDYTTGGQYGQFYSKRVRISDSVFSVDINRMQLPQSHPSLIGQEDDVGIGVDQTGNVFVAWRYGQDQTTAPIQGSALFAGASSWSPLQDLSDANYNHNVSFSLNPLGEGVVAWNQGASANGNTQPFKIYAKKFNLAQNQVSFSDLIPVASSEAAKVEYPSCFIDQYGNIVVTWNDSNDNNAYLSFYQKDQTTPYLTTQGLGSSDSGETAGLYINRSQIEKGVAIWASQNKETNTAQPFFIFDPNVAIMYQLNLEPVHYQ